MEAAVYLAEHASSRVAHAYMDEFERVAGIVEMYPELGTPEDDGLRSYPSLKFKYSLIYFETNRGPLIVAIAPHRREPGYWKTRLQKT